MYAIYETNCPFPHLDDRGRSWDPAAQQKARKHFHRIAAILAEELHKAGLTAE